MVAKKQPAKLAAFEAHFKTGPADLNLFGIPDEEPQVKMASGDPRRAELAGS